MDQETTSSTGPSREQIAERAYHIWVENGRRPGDGTENWFEAERRLREEISARGATARKAASRKPSAKKPLRPKKTSGDAGARRRPRTKAPPESASGV